MKSIPVSNASRSAILSAALLALALALPQFSASGQATDSRWTPYLGCWAPIEAGVISISGVGATDNLVCVVPSSSGSGVDVASIVGTRMIARTRVDAGGARNVKTVDDCAGWESAKWSADGFRVLFRAEFRCANNVVRKESGVFSMTPEGQWLDVQGVDVVGTTSTRAVRFRDIGLEPAVLRTVATAVVGDTLRLAATGRSSFAMQSLRAAAAGRITPDAVLDVSRSVDVPVAEAWLNETGQTFDVDARTLVRLADAGLPPRMIDLLVALSYPQTFAVRRSLSRGANSRAPGVEWHESTLSTSSVFQVMCAGVPASFGQLGQDDCYSRSRYGSMYDPFGYGYGYSSRSGYGYGNGYGSRYGNGYYYGSQPIIIIDRGSGTGAAAQNSGARAVNGRGYTRDTRPDPTSTSGTSRSGSSGSSATPASSGSSGSGSGSSGESSSGGRTAKARGGSQ